MGLRQGFSDWFEMTRDALDFGEELPAVIAARRRGATVDLATLRQSLEEAQRSCRQKDELIAKLQATGPIKAEMVADASAYYIRKKTSLDGPFCISCFQRDHKMSRIAIAAKPPEADGNSADWVQCVKCRIPFQSGRISQYLNSAKTDVAQTPVSPGGSDRPESIKASPKPRTRTRRPKKSPSEQPARTRRSAKPRSRRSTTSPRTSAKDTTSPPITVSDPTLSLSTSACKHSSGRP
jgi:hypothetical protein